MEQHGLTGPRCPDKSLSAQVELKDGLTRASSPGVALGEPRQNPGNPAPALVGQRPGPREGLGKGYSLRTPLRAAESFFLALALVSCGDSPLSPSSAPAGRSMALGVSSHYEVPSSTPFGLVRMDQDRLVEVDGKQMIAVVAYGDKATVAQRCAEAAARGFWVEIWNEPNLPEYWGAEPDPEAYVELVRECREAAPRATLLGPGIGGAVWDWGYLEAVRDAPFDVVTVHAYASAGNPEELPDVIWRVKRLFPAKRIGITEVGYPDDTAAEMLPRLLDAAERSGVEFLVLYSWRDDPDGGSFGLVEHDETPRPAYGAVLDFLKGR